MSNFAHNPTSTEPDQWALARRFSQLDHDSRLAKFLATVGKRAIAKKRDLDAAAVPPRHESRSLIVSAAELKEASDLGYTRLMGLTLVAQ